MNKELTMTTHGRISQFHPGKEDWSTWAAQLKYYFTANKVTEDDQKRAILLSNVPPSIFKLVRNIFGDDIETTSFDRIVKSVKAHYEPQPSEIVQRFKFNTRSRNSGETVAVYVAELRDIAQDCNYGNTLKEMLRDRLVCGINHQGIQRKLLAEKSLDFDKAYALALSVEAAEKDSKDLQSQPQPQILQYQTQSTPPKPTSVTCYRCGGPHLATVCKHITMDSVQSLQEARPFSSCVWF